MAHTGKYEVGHIFVGGVLGGGGFTLLLLSLGFDNLGNPIYIDQNGNPSLISDGCQISPDFNSGGGGENGNGGGGGIIPDDEKIIAFVKKNWMYLLAVTAGIYLLTKK